MTKIYNKEVTNREESSSSSGVDTHSSGFPPAKSISSSKVKKSTTSHHKMDSNVSNDEMQSLLAKLKELVPNIPRNKKLTKLEIIQYVIDYIFDLQLALESHPQSSLCQTSNNSSPSSSTISLRQPLAIKYSS